MNTIIRFLSITFFIALPSFSQETEQDTIVQPAPNIRVEFPEDEYIPVPRKGRETSPAFRFSKPGIFTVQVNVTESGENILGDAANEPSIAIDPNDPSRMVIGWRQFDTVSSNFRQAGYGYTTNGGRTWIFPGVIEPGVFRSDPVLDSDAEGNFYFFSLTIDSTDYACDVFKSFDGGAIWDSGTSAYGGDKPWMVIDKTDGIGEGHIYASWTQGTSICAPGFFTRSTDDGLSFEECVTIPDSPFYGTLAVGPDGELYACGVASGRRDDFVVAKSFTAKDSSQSVSWDFTTIVDLDGIFRNNTGPNPDGLIGQVWIAVDHSTEETRGNVYLLCSVMRSSPYEPLDVMFARSTDGGTTWGSPVRVNDDASSIAYQWFGTMSVAPNGRIDVIWLDTRDNPFGFHSSLYYAYSTDAGVSWSENERLSDAFDPHIGWPQQDKLGDYFDMVSDTTGVHLAWAATFNGEQDVYYSHISLPYGDLIGDVNWDGTINVQDVLAVLNHILDIQNLEGDALGRADCNDDGHIDVLDALNIVNIILGIIPECPGGNAKTIVSNKTVEFIKALAPHFSADKFERFMAMVKDRQIADEFSLNQNYPNPFNPETTIEYALPELTRVKVEVYNLLGQVVDVLVNSEIDAGFHKVQWNGESVSSGVYFYRLMAGEFCVTKRMVLMK